MKIVCLKTKTMQVGSRFWSTIFCFTNGTMKLKQSAWLLLLLLYYNSNSTVERPLSRESQVVSSGTAKGTLLAFKGQLQQKQQQQGTKNKVAKQPTKRRRWPLFFSSLRKFGLKQTSSHERLLKLKTEKCSVTNSMRFHSLKNGINSCALEAFILDFQKDFFCTYFGGRP